MKDLITLIIKPEDLWSNIIMRNNCEFINLQITFVQLPSVG